MSVPPNMVLSIEMYAAAVESWINLGAKSYLAFSNPEISKQNIPLGSTGEVKIMSMCGELVPMKLQDCKTTK